MLEKLEKLDGYIDSAERAIGEIGKMPSFAYNELSPQQVADDAQYALREVLDTVKLIKEILEGIGNGV